jgi:hypothetical protein
MMYGVRTTVTLTPENEALIKKAMAERGLSFKEVVNDAITRGLQPAARPRVSLPSFNMGSPLVNLDKATQLAGDLEDEEILRKMSMGK